MITSEERDESLDYLADTDAEYARAKAYMIGVEAQKKTILATQSLHSDLKTQGLRDHDAYRSNEYWQWRDEYKDSVYEYEILRNKRSTAALRIEIWRSEFSARKQGMVV